MVKKIKEGFDKEGVKVELYDLEDMILIEMYDILVVLKVILLGFLIINKIMVKFMWDLFFVIDLMVN